MTGHRSLLPRTLAAAVTVALTLPASALAQDSSGGTAPGPGDTGGTSVPDGSSPSLTGGPSVLLGRTMLLRGSVGTPNAGVVVERLDPELGWTAVARARSGSDGSFVARWRPQHIGRFSLRAVTEGSDAHSSQSYSTVATVYRPARATWYGPGFYGRRTACRQRMSRSLVGVAHPKLPCGTRVALYHRGRTLIVPVVDRGPFANGASWDLTYATSRALGFRATGTIGALRLR